MIRFDEPLFNALPINYFMIEADPRFTIVAATDQHLLSIGCTRKSVIGEGVFDRFPDNPDNKYDNSANLRASFNYVIEKKQTHLMETLRYDVESVNGFEAKYWSIINTPYEQDGKLYIINSAIDVTKIYQLTQLN